MKRLKRFWQRLPKPLRALVYLLAIAAVCLALYTFVGAPAFSTEQEFRRAEKANMVGPGRILCDVELETIFPGYQRMLVADTDEGIIFYCYDHVHSDSPALYYREKTGDITVLAAPTPTNSRNETTQVALPVFVFDNCPEAVRAELDLTISIQLSGKPFQTSYHLESAREGDGYFRFILDILSRSPIGTEGHAIQRLILFSGYGGRTQTGTDILATVRLYDAADSLIGTYQVPVRSVMEEAHSES